MKQTGSVSLKATPPLTIIIYKTKYPEYDTSQFSLIKNRAYFFFHLYFYDI